jgi:hypothetical protein
VNQQECPTGHGEFEVSEEEIERAVKRSIVSK